MLFCFRANKPLVAKADSCGRATVLALLIAEDRYLTSCPDGNPAASTPQR